MCYQFYFTCEQDKIGSDRIGCVRDQSQYVTGIGKVLRALFSSHHPTRRRFYVREQFEVPFIDSIYIDRRTLT